MTNKDIRDSIYCAGIKQWQLAEALGISESVLSRKLRHELSEKEKQTIFTIIQQLLEQQKGARNA